MKVKYVKSKGTYVISSHVVARNHLFINSHYCSRFLNGFEKHLGPLCKLVSYSLSRHEFTMVVEIYERDAFVRYYEKKKREQGKDVGLIPETTYIFSQAMANLLSGMAIHFNRKEGRTGAMFARRFQKYLISSQAGLDYWLDRIHSKKKTHRYEKRWRWGRKKKRKKRGSRGEEWLRNSAKLYGFKLKKGRLLSENSWLKDNRLQGQTKIISFIENFIAQNEFHPTFTPP